MGACSHLVEAHRAILVSKPPLLQAGKPTACRGNSKPGTFQRSWPEATWWEIL